MPKPTTPPFRASTLAEVRRNALMDVTCTSGSSYTIRALTLDELATSGGSNGGGLPDDLYRVVLLEQLPGGVVAEIGRNLQSGKPAELEEAKKLAAANVELRDRIVLAAVVAPKLTAKDVAGLDPFDKGEIAAFAQRKLNVDATGKQVGADALGFFRGVCDQLGRSESDPARKALLLELAELQ